MEKYLPTTERKQKRMSKATEALILKTTGSMITKLSIETQWSKHMLGLLRNALASGEENPEILGWMFTEIPEEISGRNGYMSRAEKAIYLALCIYASVGKKSISDSSMIQAMKNVGMERTNLVQVELSKDLETIRMPLHMLTQRIASHGGKFSCAILAQDLYIFQFDKMQVIRKWERDFAKENKKQKEGAE